MYEQERERERVVQVGRMSRLSCKLVYFMKVFTRALVLIATATLTKYYPCVTAHHSLAYYKR
jgi:hypothetical protein